MGQRIEEVHAVGLTYDDDQHDAPPRLIEGVLHRRWVEEWQNYQCFINGVLVNPATVEIVSPPNTATEET